MVGSGAFAVVVVIVVAAIPLGGNTIYLVGLLFLAFVIAAVCVVAHDEPFRAFRGPDARTISAKLPVTNLRVLAAKLTTIWVFALVFTGIGLWIKSGHHADVDPAVFSSQLDEIKKLDRFIGDVDEMDLRAKFGFLAMETINIDVVGRCEQKFFETGVRACDYSPYVGKGWLLSMNTTLTRLSRTRYGFHTAWDPSVVMMVIEPPAYVDARRAMSQFEHSADLPTKIISAITNFDKALDENVVILNEVLNDALQESPKNFIEARDPRSPRYGVVNAMYADRFVQLQPKADRIIVAIRDYLKIK